MLKLSSRVDILKQSVTLEIDAKAKALQESGVDVVNLAAGEPDFDTPPSIKNAAIDALRKGFTKYSNSQGLPVLRKVISQFIETRRKFSVTPDEIIVTAGAKHAIFLALQCLIEPGDYVLLPIPAWISYVPCIELAGGKVIPLPLHGSNGFQIDLDEWKKMALPPTCRGIIINTPNNPTGVCLNYETLKALVAWAIQRNLWILSDEIYADIVFDGQKHFSIASLGSEELRQCVITIDGLSKNSCMTGWRLGWAIATSELIKKMTAYQSHSNSHVATFVQMAALEAFNEYNVSLPSMVKEFDQRRRFCIKALDELSEYLSYTRPTGAFYFFINLSKWLTKKKMNDIEFCKRFLEKFHVGVVPGEAFGIKNHIRISYATSIENLKKGMARLGKFLESK